MKIHMLHKIRTTLRGITKESWFVALFGASFLVGIWYAFPMVNTITDVWPFGGGVLRAMEAHTLLPGYGVAYGTLTFYQNYVLMIVALVFGYIALGFDAEALKTLLILNPSYSLVVPRVASALTAMVLLGIVYRFLRQHVPSLSWRLALIVLTFANVLAALLTRSGKMWMLSMLFGVVSFIYLYRALTEEVNGRPGRLSATSIITAFLATANFAFAGLFLVTIPILLYAFPRTYETFKRLGIMVGAGALIFLAFFALNASNTIAQVSGFVTQFVGAGGEVVRAEKALTLLESFKVNARQTIESFPLLLLALIPALVAGIRDKVLARLAVLYIVIYVIAVSVIFRADDGLALNIRHCFPIGFFLMFLLAAYRPPARVVSVTLVAVGLAVYVYTLLLLSIPTTYNRAYDFVKERYGNADIRIEERIFELTLPMNKASYELFSVESCGSTCQHMRARDDHSGFRPIVTTKESDPTLVATLPPPNIIVVEQSIQGCSPLAQFVSGVEDHEVFDIDINLGRMLMSAYYRLDRLGKNIYLYDAKECRVALETSF